MSDQRNPQDEGQVSEVGGLESEDADTPITDGDAVAGYPESESGSPDEPEEAGPNANPHRDQGTH